VRASEMTVMKRRPNKIISHTQLCFLLSQNGDNSSNSNTLDEYHEQTKLGKNLLTSHNSQSQPVSQHRAHRNLSRLPFRFISPATTDCCYFISVTVVVVVVVMRCVCVICGAVWLFNFRRNFFLVQRGVKQLRKKRFNCRVMD